MPKVNVNAFGVVNLKFAAYALKSTNFNFPVSNRQSTVFNGRSRNAEVGLFALPSQFHNMLTNLLRCYELPVYPTVFFNM